MVVSIEVLPDHVLAEDWDLVDVLVGHDSQDCFYCGAYSVAEKKTREPVPLRDVLYAGVEH